MVCTKEQLAKTKHYVSKNAIVIQDSSYDDLGLRVIRIAQDLELRVNPSYDNRECVEIARDCLGQCYEIFFDEGREPGQIELELVSSSKYDFVFGYTFCKYSVQGVLSRIHLDGNRCFAGATVMQITNNNNNFACIECPKPSSVLTVEEAMKIVGKSANYHTVPSEWSREIFPVWWYLCKDKQWRLVYIVERIIKKNPTHDFVTYIVDAIRDRHQPIIMEISLDPVPHYGEKS
jgi:hypothetical protein